MKNVPEMLRALQRLGYRVEHTRASTAKIYPPDKNKPFYSFHVGERGLHPLRRFAKANWGLDITTV